MTLAGAAYLCFSLHVVFGGRLAVRLQGLFHEQRATSSLQTGTCINSHVCCQSVWKERRWTRTVCARSLQVGQLNCENVHLHELFDSCTCPYHTRKMFYVMYHIIKAYHQLCSSPWHTPSHDKSISHSYGIGVDTVLTEESPVTIWHSHPMSLSSWTSKKDTWLLWKLTLPFT